MRFLVLHRGNYSSINIVVDSYCMKVYFDDKYKKMLTLPMI